MKQTPFSLSNTLWDAWCIASVIGISASLYRAQPFVPLQNPFVYPLSTKCS